MLVELNNMNCSICCELFNKSTRKKIECKTCDNEEMVSCRTCCKKYFVDNSISPKCMCCKKEWDKEFLTENFPQSFLNNEIKLIQENVLLEKEIAKLPETQEYAQKLKLIHGLEKQIDLNILEKNKLLLKLQSINKHHVDICVSIEHIRNSLNNGSKVPETTTHSCKCPVDNCKGFLDSTNFCGLCENTICKKCMEIKEEDHKCDEEKVETIKLLKKDTKPCPKCGQLIFKINGCDQMWCPPCHTPFSWKTGQVENGNVHNPEYYRWMRENNTPIPRDPQDRPYEQCGNNVPTYNQLIVILRKNFPSKLDKHRVIDSSETVYVLNMHRMVRHIEGVVLNVRDEEHSLRDLRAQFLLNKITKDSWKNKLQIIDKRREKENKYINTWNLLNMVLIEYLGKIMENSHLTDCIEIIKQILSESKRIIMYCNESFKKIGKMYNCVYPGITSGWIQIDNYKQHLKKLEKNK